jgi:hypothetical protein
VNRQLAARWPVFSEGRCAKQNWMPYESGHVKLATDRRRNRHGAIYHRQQPEVWAVRGAEANAPDARLSPEPVPGRDSQAGHQGRRHDMHAGRL